MSPELETVLEKIRRADLVEFAKIDLDGPNVRSPLSGETPLHVVATWGDVDAARILLDAGAEIDVSGEKGNTPLHEAICQEHVEMVRFLISRGADIRRRGAFGNASDLAVLTKNENIKALLRQSA